MPLRKGRNRSESTTCLRRFGWGTAFRKSAMHLSPQRTGYSHGTFASYLKCGEFEYVRSASISFGPISIDPATAPSGARTHLASATFAKEKDASGSSIE